MVCEYCCFMVFGTLMRYFRYLLLISALVFTGAFLNENGMKSLEELEGKKGALSRENQELALDIESLERMVGKLRTDPRTVELAANRKLGMIRQDETIYVFRSSDRKAHRTVDPDYGQSLNP